MPHYYRGELVGTSRQFDERLTVALLALRGQLATIPPARHHEHVMHAPDDFEALVERVETGDELWGELGDPDPEEEDEL